MKILGASVIECLSTQSIYTPYATLANAAIGLRLGKPHLDGRRTRLVRIWMAVHSYSRKTASLICASTRAKCLKHSGPVASDATGARFPIAFHNPAGGLDP
jgi:hypothetical protein